MLKIGNTIHGSFEELLHCFYEIFMKFLEDISCSKFWVKSTNLGNFHIHRLVGVVSSIIFTIRMWIGFTCTNISLKRKWAKVCLIATG